MDGFAWLWHEKGKGKGKWGLGGELFTTKEAALRKKDRGELFIGALEGNGGEGRGGVMWGEVMWCIRFLYIDSFACLLWQ